MATNGYITIDDLQGVFTKLDDNIKAVEQRLNSKVYTMESRINGRVDTLESKVDALSIQVTHILRAVSRPGP